MTIKKTSPASHIYGVAFSQCLHRRTCYPNWYLVEKESGYPQCVFQENFECLCSQGKVFDGFPSLLIELADIWPLVPMFGPLLRKRPTSAIWSKIRTSIFQRDNYTCQYCGAYGVHLECDHVIPVAAGGGHENDNLITACLCCNRSKRDKTLDQWVPTCR